MQVVDCGDGGDGVWIDLESSGVWRGQLDVGRALEQRDI